MGMEGAVVKISAGATDHDMHAMYKVNVEDLSQLLAYHEVFGKLNSDGQPQQQPKVNTSLLYILNNKFIKELRLIINLYKIDIKIITKGIHEIK